MPIYKGEDKTESAYKGSAQLARIYKGNSLVYENYKTITAEGIPPITLSNCKNTDMLGYKVYGNSKQQSLPDGYTQLEYIEATGTQYIDLGIKPKNASFELTMSNPTSTVTSGTYACGVYSTPRIMLYFAISTSNYIRANINGTTTDSATLVSDVSVAKYDNSTGVFSYNDFNSTSIGTQTFTSSDNFYLFAANNGGTPYNLDRIQTLRIHNAKLWNDNVLVRNMVPAKNSSNVIGMYDTVSNAFYTNAGTGTFVAGPVAPTPETPIEIESVGDKTYNLWNPSDTNYGWINTDGTLSTSIGVGRRITVEVGKTYNYVSTNQSTGGFYNCIAQFDENMNFISGTRVNITNSQKEKTNTVTITNSSTKYLICAYYITSPYVAPETNMIVEGATVPDYKPYGYEIPIITSGKNLWQGVNYYKYVSGETPIPAGTTAAIRADVNYLNSYIRQSAITLSADIILGADDTATDRRLSAELRDTNGTKITTILSRYSESGRYSVTVPQTSNIGYVVFRFGDYATQNTIDIEVTNIQIELGSTASAYETAVAPNTNSIYLDAPLRKIGTYSDYIDFETGKVVRNTDIKELEGTETWSFYTNINSINFCIIPINDSTFKDINYGENSNLLSNYYNYGGRFTNFDSVTSSNKLFYIIYGNNPRIGFVAPDDITSGNEWKTYLSNKYTQGESIIVVYQLVTPTEESITLPDILLNKGTNIVNVGTSITPSNMWIKYKGKEN